MKKISATVLTLFMLILAVFPAAAIADEANENSLPDLKAEVYYGMV